MSEDSEKMVRDIHRALIGDPLNPDKNPGLVKTVNALRDDMNGTKLQPIGIRHKVDTLWENRTKVIIIGSCITAIVGVAAWLIPLIIKH